jgi:hypothetical protein
MALMTVEAQIMQAVIAVLLEQGYSLSVNDGEEITVRKSKNAAEIFNAMRTTDEDYLLVHTLGGFDNRWQGWVRFVYGNDGWDVINDYSMNMDAVLEPVNNMANDFGRQYI